MQRISIILIRFMFTTLQLHAADYDPSQGQRHCESVTHELIAACRISCCEALRPCAATYAMYRSFTDLIEG